jgi:hypothetical protein
MNDVEKARKDHGESNVQQLLPDEKPALYERRRQGYELV